MTPRAITQDELNILDDYFGKHHQGWRDCKAETMTPTPDNTYTFTFPTREGDQTYLHQACLWAREFMPLETTKRVVDILVAAGHSINTAVQPALCDKEIGDNITQLVEHLIALGANPSATGTHGTSALFMTLAIGLGYNDRISASNLHRLLTAMLKHCPIQHINTAYRDALFAELFSAPNFRTEQPKHIAHQTITPLGVILISTHLPDEQRLHLMNLFLDQQADVTAPCLDKTCLDYIRANSTLNEAYDIRVIAQRMATSVNIATSHPFGLLKRKNTDPLMKLDLPTPTSPRHSI